MEKKLNLLKNFIGFSQLKVLTDGLKSEESSYFKDKINEIFTTISSMPKSYETDGKGDNAIVYLHYFKGGMDWFITEKDKEEEQLQAFGLVCMDLSYPELGYIPIQNLIRFEIQLDLNWTAKSLKEVKEGLK